MNKEKQIDEMRYLADEMGKAISSEYEKRVLADERKLEAVLKENGWCKSSDVVREIFEDLRQMWKNGRGFIRYLDLVRLERLYEQKYTEDGN